MSETLDEQSRLELVKYRIERADETLREAELLASEGFFNAAVNRLYYGLLLIPLLFKRYLNHPFDR